MIGLVMPCVPGKFTDLAHRLVEQHQADPLAVVDHLRFMAVLKAATSRWIRSCRSVSMCAAFSASA